MINIRVHSVTLNPAVYVTLTFITSRGQMEICNHDPSY